MGKRAVVVAKNRKTGEVTPVTELEDGGVMYHPAKQALDLSHEEKRRTTALMMAVQAHEQMIVRDAEYYRAVRDDERRGEGPKIRPATFDSIVEGAMRFDWFISGEAERYQKENGNLKVPEPAAETSEQPEDRLVSEARR